MPVHQQAYDERRTLAFYHHLKQFPMIHTSKCFTGIQKADIHRGSVFIMMTNNFLQNKTTHISRIIIIAIILDIIIIIIIAIIIIISISIAIIIIIVVVIIIIDYFVVAITVLFSYFSAFRVLHTFRPVWLLEKWMPSIHWPKRHGLKAK